MKTNLVIYPSDPFIKKGNEFNNLFVDRYTFDQSETKDHSDQFFASRLDYDYRINNYNLSNILFYEILECVKKELNLILKKNFDQKFFEIIIGAWLRKFIQQFVLKYQNIIEINKKFKIQNVMIHNTDDYNFFTTETQTIQNATSNNLWNSCIYSYILSNLNLNIEIKTIYNSEKNFDDSKFLNWKTTTKTKNILKKISKDVFVYLTNLLPNNSNILMYNTGFKISTEKKIDLMFGQMPRIYSNDLQFKYSNFDFNLRKKLNFEKFTKISNKAEDHHFVEIFNLIIQILNKSLPIFAIEDFDNLIKYSEKLKLPTSPKAICTSYAFQSDEPFKFYVAMKKFINPKIKYFIYQHGGSYITNLNNNFVNECQTCDYFITWGDKINSTKKNNIKFVNYKLLNKKYFKKKKLNKFLILMRSSGYNALPYDRYSEGLQQIDLTIKLCKNFSPELVKDTIIRAHYSSKNKFQNIIKDLSKFKIDYSEQNYFDAINSAKLILFNHDSTGLLEMLALNKPTLCMWKKGHEHHNTFVVEDYELLKDAKIFFDDHEKLHQHLINIWNEPLRWWYSDNVQKNLHKFVNLYTKMPDINFPTEFKKIIKDRI